MAGRRCRSQCNPHNLFDRARQHAETMMQKPPQNVAACRAAGHDQGPRTSKVRSTQGSPIYADHIPAKSSFVVTTIETAGGIIAGKTNTPEFGAGANTFNPVLARHEPWNIAFGRGVIGRFSRGLGDRHGMAGAWPDLGGSLRNPASFGIVGMRPSPGRQRATIQSF